MGTFGRVKNRNIRVKFSCQRHVDDIMKKVKVSAVKVGDVLPNGQSPGDAVYVHRRHPLPLQKLRIEVRKQYPNILPRNIWISFCSVNVRYAEDKPPIRLTPSAGLEPLNKLIN